MYRDDETKRTLLEDQLGIIVYTEADSVSQITVHPPSQTHTYMLHRPLGTPNSFSKNVFSLSPISGFLVTLKRWMAAWYHWCEQELFGMRREASCTRCTCAEGSNVPP